MWMRAVVRSVVATQQSNVGGLPLHLQNGQNTSGVQVPPLPFGLNEKRYSRADGGRQMMPVDQPGHKAEAVPKEAWFFDPAKGDYHEAIRPCAPLINRDGAIVDEATWAEQSAAESKQYWNGALSSSASGILPECRRGATLEESLPSDE